MGVGREPPKEQHTDIRWGETVAVTDSPLTELLLRTWTGSIFQQKTLGTMRSTGRRRVPRRVHSTLWMKREHTVLLQLLSPLPCQATRKERRKRKCTQAMLSAVTAACTVTSWSRTRQVVGRHLHAQ